MNQFRLHNKMDKTNSQNRMDNKVSKNRLDKLIEGKKSPLIPDDFYVRKEFGIFENDYEFDDDICDCSPEFLCG